MFCWVCVIEGIPWWWWGMMPWVLLPPLDVQTKKGRTAAMYAARYGQTDCLAALIDHMGTIANAFNKMSLGVGGGSAGSLAGTHDAPAEAPFVAHLDAGDKAGGLDGDGGAVAIAAPEVGVMTPPSAHDATGPSNSLKLLMANQVGA